MTPIIGMIQPFGFNFVPQNWLPCEGQLLNPNTYPSLFSLIGTTYGGNGIETFGIPDLRGRMPIGMGQGPGLTDRVLGQMWGTEENTLQVANLPAHSPTATTTISGTATSSLPVWDDSSKRNTASAKNAYVCSQPGPIFSSNPPTDGDSMGPAPVDLSKVSATTTIQSIGSGVPTNNMQPFLVLNWCIAYEGIYPNRS